MREIPGLDFISIYAVVKLWNEFVESFKKFHEDETMTIIITQEQHTRFFEQTAKEFVKTYNTIFQASVDWSVPNYCRM
jgi:23S rRNA G2445 N2-methylase RlmL